ncbi:PadR family transcriptional regulator [Arthrobacter pigmenti]
MADRRPTESQEWVSERIDSWIETYKKSMLTPVILALVAAQQPATIANVAEGIASTTDWQITERGLYRTIRRLRDQGLLISTDVDSPRTGAKRQELSLTPLGVQFLSGVTANLVALPGDTNS